MNLWLQMQIARNDTDLIEVDFSTEEWRAFQAQMSTEGIDLYDFLPDVIAKWETDPSKLLYKTRVDARLIRTLWLNHEEKLEYVPLTGGWIPDTVIPPHEWMCPGRGDSYWWWGPNCPYVVGITIHDLVQAET